MKTNPVKKNCQIKKNQKNVKKYKSKRKWCKKNKLSLQQKRLKSFLVRIKRSASSPEKFKNLMVDLNEQELSQLTEVILNVVKNPHSNGQKIALELTPHKTNLRFVSNNKKSLAQKRRKILQMGEGVISSILGFIIPAIAGLFAK